MEVKATKAAINIERDVIPLEINKRGLGILSLAALLTVLILIWFNTGYNKPVIIEPEQKEGQEQNDVFISEASKPSETQEEIFDIVEAMGVGWNLGNSLDSLDYKKRGIVNGLRDNRTAEEFYETYWGNPLTTPQMIASIAEMGFGAVRIPVTYVDHLYEDFTIRPGWLKRVKKIVDYVLENGMYCIINTHHDTGTNAWIRANPDKIDQIAEQLAAVWGQIAEYFKNYDDKLIFEGFNEIVDMNNNWSNADNKVYEAVNTLNQTFVDAVRSTGGKNAERYLIVKTYASGTTEEILSAFRLPDDTAENRLMVGAHVYGTQAFTWRQENVSWTETYSTWTSARDGAPVENALKRLKTNFTDKGIPVIITEFGAVNKNNTSARINYATHYVETAKECGIACFWWDDGGKYKSPEVVKNFALFDRYNNTWLFPEIAEAVINAAK